MAFFEEENEYAGEWWTRRRVIGEEFREVVHVQMTKTHEGSQLIKSTVVSHGSLYTEVRQDLLCVLK